MHGCAVACDLSRSVSVRRSAQNRYGCPDIRVWPQRGPPSLTPPEWAAASSQTTVEFRGRPRVAESGKGRSNVTKPVRVLVVDGFRDAREMYVEYLALKGYHVIAAADGLEAVKMAEALIPDVIVLDIGLPKLSGFSVLRKLKAGSRTQSIHVITLSARA